MAEENSNPQPAKAETPSKGLIIVRAMNALRASKSPSFYRLRRGNSLMDAMLEPIFPQLRRELAGAGYRYVRDDNLACALLLLAQLRDTTTTEKVAAALGNSQYSLMRFQQLMASSNPDALHRSMRRALQFLKLQANPFDLVDIALDWTPNSIDLRRKKMVAHYHAPRLETVISE